MTRLLRAAALPPLLLGALAVSGCEAIVGQAKATGAIPEILIVADSTTWAGPVGEALRAELAQPISTLPGNQGAFRLRHQPLDRALYEAIQQQRNVVFAAPIDERSTVGEFIRARIPDGSEEAIRSGRAVGVNVRPDLWARDQIVVLATAASDSALAEAVLERGPELREAFNELARRNTIEDMFAKARQTDVEDALLREQGWAVNVQHDYVEVQDTTATAAGRTGHFTRFRRVLSTTWRDFFVFTQDGVSDLPSEAELNRLTDDLLETFARGSYDSSYVQIDTRRPLESDTTTLAGRPALETRGIWYMTDDLMGGPFVRYAFVDPATDRLYVYYGMVFAPDREYDKREFLRQMEAIAYTFRTRADAPSS